jgi:hypothetical protein
MEALVALTSFGNATSGFMLACSDERKLHREATALTGMAG